MVRYDLQKVMWHVHLDRSGNCCRLMICAAFHATSCSYYCFMVTMSGTVGLFIWLLLVKLWPIWLMRLASLLMLLIPWVSSFGSYDQLWWLTTCHQHCCYQRRYCSSVVCLNYPAPVQLLTSVSDGETLFSTRADDMSSVLTLIKQEFESILPSKGQSGHPRGLVLIKCLMCGVLFVQKWSLQGQGIEFFLFFCCFI